jgi:hypothetical protein
MQNVLDLLKKGWTVFIRRVRTQGITTTLVWMYGRGVPYLTGTPLLQYSEVTPHLYVGPQFRERGKRLLQARGINACVNMRIERDDAAYGLALEHYLHLPTIDDAAPSLEHLEQGVDFIRDVLSSGGKVYIHCGAGVGRAPSMAAAYLMAEGHTLEEALTLIRKPRPFIAITPPQMEQLRKLEALYLEQGVISTSA